MRSISPAKIRRSGSSPSNRANLMLDEPPLIVRTRGFLLLLVSCCAGNGRGAPQSPVVGGDCVTLSNLLGPLIFSSRAVATYFAAKRGRGNVLRGHRLYLPEIADEAIAKD